MNMAKKALTVINPLNDVMKIIKIRWQTNLQRRKAMHRSSQHLQPNIRGYFVLPQLAETHFVWVLCCGVPTSGRTNAQRVGQGVQGPFA